MNTPSVSKTPELGRMRLFPNSGFHQQFFPLLTLDPNKNTQYLKGLGLNLPIRNIAGGTNEAEGMTPEQATAASQTLRTLVDKEPDWRNRLAIKDTKPWLHSWFGVQERKVYSPSDPSIVHVISLIGIWVAVETNVGTRNRGFTTRISSPPTQEEIETANSVKQMGTPYVFENLADVKGSQQVCFSVNAKGEDIGLGCCTVEWLTAAGQPIEVDLIVDFGNTRSAVLALEHIPNSPSLAPICKPIPFCSREETFAGYSNFEFGDVLADSWLLLKQPHFESYDQRQKEIPEWDFRSIETTQGFVFRRKVTNLRLEKVTYRIPQSFISLSPVLIGKAARNELLNLDLSHGGKMFLSSPKRYAWDTDPADGPGEQNWHMVRNDGYNQKASITEIPSLHCQMLRFMPADGRDWDVGNPPTQWEQQFRPVPTPRNPQYPRSDTLAWTALAILENAYRVINSEPWRAGNMPFIPRKLRDIVVTYPSGWTIDEIQAYRSKWQKAINIFSLTNFPNNGKGNANGSPMLLRFELDEAVASQLPIVISEIRKTGDDGNKWLVAIGKGGESDSKLRAMTIDIGGGTTDISVVEYQDRLQGRGVNLEARVLFKDCSSIAGDLLRKMLIEQVLLPKVIGNKENIDKQKLEHFLSGVQSTFADYAKWSRYTRVLFLPIVNRWLLDLVNEDYQTFTITDLFQTNDDGKILQDFNRESNRMVGVELLPQDQPLSLRPRLSEVKKCISDCFSRSFLSLAKYVAAFECDLVIVSGKPSELPSIRAMLEEYLPILPSKIIFAKGYRCGAANWPLSADGKVNDAKFVTVVGAALHQAIRANLIQSWKLEVVSDQRILSQNWWGVPDGKNLSPVALRPGESRGKCKLLVGSVIGRKLLPGDSNPEPVYIVRWRNRMWRKMISGVVEIEFRRLPSQNKDGSEAIEVLQVNGLRDPLPNEGTEKIQVTNDDIELKLCTLSQDGQHWLDTGRFEVEWRD